MFGGPLELLIPAAVSALRGCALHLRGRRVIALLTIAPSRWMSKTFWYSIPLPNVPEAVITGFASESDRLPPVTRSTCRSIVTS